MVDVLNSPRTLVLSGAMGTELQRRGYPTKLPLWSGAASLDAPELVRAIHEDYVTSGADIITTNTFRTNKRTFVKAGLGERYRDATIRAVKIAQDVQSLSPRTIFVGGVVAPLEDCYETNLVPSNSELNEEHGSQIRFIASLGVDFIFIETMNCAREAVVALRHAKATSLPIFISFVINNTGDLLSGEPFEDLVKYLIHYAPEVVLLNCRPPALIESGLKKLRAIYNGALGVYANGVGHPANEFGWEFNDNHGTMTPELYVEYTRRWMTYNLKIIGGCCGTTPAHIRAISRFIHS